LNSGDIVVLKGDSGFIGGNATSNGQ